MSDSNIDLKGIEDTIKNIDENKESKIDWTNVWSKKYPILERYQQEVNIEKYAIKISEMLQELEQQYKFSKLDSMLVLKDILYHVWKDKKI